MRHDWRSLLFGQLSRRAEARGVRLRIPITFLGGDGRVERALLIDGGLRVRVDEAMLERLAAIDAEAYLAGLASEGARRAWRKAAASLRESLGATVSLHSFGVALCMPRYCPRRRSPSLSVYESFCAEPEALGELLEPTQLAQLRALRAELGRAPRLREIGEQLFPHPAEDPDAYPDFGDIEADGGPLDGGDSAWARHRNVIFFGPPGTGKSYTVQQIVSEHLRAPEGRVIRVSFHPEYSYFDFVGSYKPAVGWLEGSARFRDADGRVGEREPRSYYRFEPGPLSRALQLAAASPGEPVALVIEEINRGNTAAIFGDVFQLLDRVRGSADPGRVGWSSYPIHPAGDWAGWLAARLPSGSGVYDRERGRLSLPPNLYLYATMNTSDQGLYPMDTAFRRRWGMAYRGVEGSGDPGIRVRLHARDERGLPWLDLMAALNEAIVDYTRSDDKQVGPWFVQPAAGGELVEAVEFKSKVLFYLWAEVFRDDPSRVFRPGISTYERLLARYDAGRQVFSEEVLARAGAGR